MITKASHGTATCETISIAHWRAAVDEIACHTLAMEDGEIDAVVTRERLARYYVDGMTVAMAADDVVSWVKLSRPGRRADRDVAALARAIAIGNK